MVMEVQENKWDYLGWQKLTNFKKTYQTDWNQTLITRINNIFSNSEKTSYFLIKSPPRFRNL